jgi:hypothetical protein
MTKRLNDATPDEWDAVSRKWVQGEQYREARIRRKGSQNGTTANTPKDHNKQYNNIHSPEHYNQGQIECIDSIEAMLSVEEYIGYLRGNSMKYRWRFRYKNGFEDLSKAQWYEGRLVKFMEDHDVLGQKG